MPETSPSNGPDATDEAIRTFIRVQARSSRSGASVRPPRPTPSVPPGDNAPSPGKATDADHDHGPPVPEIVREDDEVPDATGPSEPDLEKAGTQADAGGRPIHPALQPGGQASRPAADPPVHAPVDAPVAPRPHAPADAIAEPSAPPAADASAPGDLGSRFSDLERMVHDVKGEHDEMRSAASNMKELEKRLAKLANLSEVLSARYNPFLSMESQDAFADEPEEADDKRHSSLPDDDGGAAAMPPAAAPHPSDQDARRPGEGQPTPAPAAVRPETAAAQPRVPEVTLPPARVPSDQDSPLPATATDALATPRPTGHDHAGAPDPHVDRHHGPDQRHDGPADRRPQRPRVVMPRKSQAYLALRWFEYLLEPGRPGLMYWFLDRFQSMGWLAAEDHAWLVELAEGIAARPERMEGPQDMDPRTLVRMHHQSLRFLEQIAGEAPVQDAWPGGW